MVQRPGGFARQQRMQQKPLGRRRFRTARRGVLLLDALAEMFADQFLFDA